MRLLAALALEPRASGLLLLDPDREVVTRAAAALARLVSAVVGRAVRAIRLGPSHGEDDLWGRGAALPAPWGRAGLLPIDDEPAVVAIPDLPSVALSAARAIVAIAGAPVAHLERNGASAAWPPNLHFVAGCARGDLGRVSPHLLDRFPLRMVGAAVDDASIDALLVEVAGAGPPAAFTSEAAARISALFEDARWASTRRSLALARAARAAASLRRAPAVEERDVDEVIACLGVEHEPPSPRTAPPRAPSLTPSPALPPDPGDVQDVLRAPQEPAGAAAARRDEMVSEDAPLAAPIALRVLDLFGEETVEIDRAHAPLQLPLERRRSGPRGRGLVLGVRRSDSTEDLAVAQTLLAALPYQAIRRANTGIGDSVILSRSDLRAYRRAPVLDALAVLVIDHTAMIDSDLLPAIHRWLAAAYRERARVCLVHVGPDGARHSLRAERTIARSVLVPAVREGLARGSADRTPLAHGLELARETIRDAVHRGRDGARDVTLVVFTDGRGNVPLAASVRGSLEGPVGREGVEDALRVAEAIAGFPRVVKVVVDPRPEHLRELPAQLAQALGARREVVG